MVGRFVQQLLHSQKSKLDDRRPDLLTFKAATLFCLAELHSPLVEGTISTKQILVLGGSSLH